MAPYQRLLQEARKSPFFTDYMNEPRASRRSRCTSPGTALHIRSPRPRPHTHTPLIPTLSSPSHPSPPLHIHLSPECPPTCTLGPAWQPELRNLLCLHTHVPVYVLVCALTAPLCTVQGGCVHTCSLMHFFFKYIYLFIYFWLCWVFVAARGLSLVVASGGYSSLRCVGFSLWWLLLLWSTGSRRAGFSSCGARTQ